MKRGTYTQVMTFIEGIDKTETAMRMNKPLVKYMRSAKGKQHLIQAFKKDKYTRIANQMTKRDPLLVMRAYFTSDTFCELMFPFDINKKLSPNARPYVNETCEVFRQFRLEAQL